MHSYQAGADRFRGDINGLRAWAVALVVLYHFKIAPVAGGFVGVDVFFVISGFLMTDIVLRGLEQPAGFSLKAFYWARVRRIVPALLVLCLCLLVLGWFFLLSADYRQLASHSQMALGFASNVRFHREAGYFDAASHDKWLLHTWSLSVEWQFYLLFPLVLMWVWRVWPKRRALVIALALLASASWGVSQWLLAGQQSAAFYLLHGRAWEMLAGALVCLWAAQR
jgi:peptidoglycan/LPS O-acetylase OafA/YrhL